MTCLRSVRPELVEGPFFSLAAVPSKERGFDKLSPNGVSTIRFNEVLA